MKSLAILGSTGSIGRQALSVCQSHPQAFRVVGLCAHHNAELLFEQVRTFKPLVAGLVVEPETIPDDLRSYHWIFGEDAAQSVAAMQEAQDVLVAVVGMAGLPAVLSCIQHQKRILLANKEALVVGGHLVMEAAKAQGVEIVTVDGEHSAIWQCLLGAQGNAFSRLWLTASGGPFRTWSQDEIKKATRSDALKHPSWNMGKKITVDSATMMNKGLEVIEAHYLFGAKPEQIRVVLHPQSIIHSMVEFADGAIIAQMGTPDMRMAIQYALTAPTRMISPVKPLDVTTLSSLTFEAPDTQKTPCLQLAYDALTMGGSAPTILNAANEVAVEAFLQGNLPFYRIANVVDDTLSRMGVHPSPNMDEIFNADRLARNMALNTIKEW